MKNLNYIVQNYKLSNGLVSTDHDQQFLQWSINGMKELSNKYKLIDEAIKGTEITITDGVGNLPADFKEFIRIGVCVNGTFINFDINDEICMTENACPCDNEQITNTINQCCGGGALTGDLSIWNYPMLGQPFSYSYTVGSYGIGPGFYHGGYKIDKAAGVIRFDNCVQATSCILEYVGDFMTNMGNAFITEPLERTLILYLNAERKLWSPDARMNAQEPSARSKYYQEVRDANSQRNTMNKAAWVSLWRQYCYLGLKS